MTAFVGNSKRRMLHAASVNLAQARDDKNALLLVGAAEGILFARKFASAANKTPSTFWGFGTPESSAKWVPSDIGRIDHRVPNELCRFQRAIGGYICGKTNSSQSSALFFFLTLGADEEDVLMLDHLQPALQPLLEQRHQHNSF